MAVVTKMISSHVKTESTPGQAQDRSSQHRHISPSRRLHILVVDDNEDAADSLAMLLFMDGHEVRSAYAGASAVRIARNWCPDAVVQDIGMPGMSGYDVARALRQRPDTRKILLIAVSGSEERARSEDAGFDHHLVKPVDFDEIRDILARLSGDVMR
jgi:CheY-like chemotaxis protein